jgi:hypothetical protein
MVTSKVGELSLKTGQTLELPHLQKENALAEPVYGIGQSRDVRCLSPFKLIFKLLRFVEGILGYGHMPVSQKSKHEKLLERHGSAWDKGHGQVSNKVGL